MSMAETRRMQPRGRLILLLTPVNLGCAWATFGNSSGRWKLLDQKISEDGQFFAFASRPDIQPPVWDVTVNNKSALASGYWFISPYEIKTQEVPGDAWVGPHIYDGVGQLIWSGIPMFGAWNVFDFAPIEIDGVPHLSGLDWHGQRGVVIDDAYRMRTTVSSLAEGDSFQNMHGFHVVDDGAHALVQTVQDWNVPPNITFASIGYNGTCEAQYQGFREVALSPGPNTSALFSWDGRQIGLNESNYFSYGFAETMCKRGWDLLHVNAVDKCPDGDYLLSARHTNTLYKISHTSGDIMWRLGGVMSDFKFSEGAAFSRQHHARCREQNETHMLVSIFDNAVGEHFLPPSRQSSRGLMLSLNLQNKSAGIAAQYEHPERALTDGRGSFEMLPNGNAFLNWADWSRVSEHHPDGTIIMQAKLKGKMDTYRAFKSPWVGRPDTLPDIHAEIAWEKDHHAVTIVSMSWNGATEVVYWNVGGFDGDGNEVQIANGVPRSGFETTLQYDGFITDVYVDALDKEGDLLGTSWTGRRVNAVSFDNQHKSVIGLIVGGSLITSFAVAGLLGFHRFTRRHGLSHVPDKGQYRMVDQNEE